MESAILATLGGTVPRKILHIQIEKSGRLEFGAYDNFHPDCVCIGSGVPAGLIQGLATEGVIERRKIEGVDS